MRQTCCALIAAWLLVALEAAADHQNETPGPKSGSFGDAIPIGVPAFRGLEPALALSYSPEGGNGFAGVGWNLTGFSLIERAKPGRGTPRYDASDIYLLNGQELIPCPQGSQSPSCTTGGSHTTKNETYLQYLATNAGTPSWMKQWLRLGRTPPGYEVDHIRPLSIGGADDPSNMRLLLGADHKIHHKFYRPWLWS